MPKISALPAATAANLTGVAILPTTDKNTLTVGTTYAQLRTALFAGGTGYATNDPIILGSDIVLVDNKYLRGAGNTRVIGQNAGTVNISADAQPTAVYGRFVTLNGVTTAGWGAPSIYGQGRVVAAVNAASGTVATYTVGAADGSFLIASNVLVTATTACTFTVTVTYTDEGNTARTLTLTFSQITGTFLTAITNVTGVGAYEGVPLYIRAKTATAITIQTAAGGTYTGVTYNVEGSIIQMA